MIYAHIGGVPVEETVLQLAPAGVAMLVLLRAWLGRLVVRPARRRSAAGGRRGSGTAGSGGSP